MEKTLPSSAFSFLAFWVCRLSVFFLFGAWKKKQDAGRTTGKILSIVSKGIHRPSILIAQYEIDGILYQKKEAIKIKNSILKIAFPLGKEKRRFWAPYARGRHRHSIGSFPPGTSHFPRKQRVAKLRKTNPWFERHSCFSKTTCFAKQPKKDSF